MTLRDDWAAEFSSERPVIARFKCPHCSIASTFQAVTVWSEQFPPNSLRYYALFRCDYARCRKIVYVITTKRVNHTIQDKGIDELTIHPSRPPVQPHKAIPSAIGEDWVEAQTVYEIGAVKAAALMCRRILYGILLDKKCKEHPLRDGIKELGDKERLPALVLQRLSEIKEEGHDAAHPHRTLTIPAENVDEVMQYTGELLRILYIEPHELALRLARKAGKTPN